MASTKRELPKEEEPEAKKSKVTLSESQKPDTKHTVKLNPADCDLDFDITTNGLRGEALHDKGFAYCWSGARANVGIKGGKYVFGCKVVAAQPVEMEDTPPNQQHVCRIGISRGDDAVGNLGETAHSFGYGGTGKFSSAGKFLDYGETFGVGDTIVCMLNLETKPLASVGFYKNGKWLGVAKEFDAGPKGLGVVDSPSRERKWESAIFPHVLLKNVVVEMQFSVEDGLVVQEGHKPWSCALEDGNTVMGPVCGQTKDCEILMMVGLPAAGKTTWAEKWVKGHPEKRYLLLGTNLALDQMKVPGLLRKQNYGERFERLMGRATEIFNTLLARAAKTPRNYIIDQTNVYKGARKRKLRPFFQFQKIAVVVFPRPEVLKRRAENRFKEMGKEVPAEAVNEMLANYVLPTSKDMLGSDEHFDQIWFPELNRDDTQRYLDEMKRGLEIASNSPYSSKGSAQSYASPLLKKATVGQQQPGPPAAYNHPGRQQVMHSANPVAEIQEQPRYISGEYRSGPGLESYGKHGILGQNQRFNSNSGSPIPGGTSARYQNFGELDSYSRSYTESRGDAEPSRHYGEVDSYYNRPIPEGSVTYGSNYGSPRTPYGSNYGSQMAPYSHRSHGDPRPAPHDPREPAFNPHYEELSTFRSNIGSARSQLPYGSPAGSQGPAPHDPREPAFNPHYEDLSTFRSNVGSTRSQLPYSSPAGSQAALHSRGQPSYSPHGPYSSSYGSSYGTPPPTLPYGNVPPAVRQQPDEYLTRPGQRYY